MAEEEKNRIVSLEQEKGVIEGETQLMDYITKFYISCLDILIAPTFL